MFTMRDKILLLRSDYWTFAIAMSVLWPFGSGAEFAPMQKRGDVDVPTCIANFDIHPDKIIRTVDSRAMGAKYLNEIDLDSREQCLRLCCETDNCDVFVFEEKNAGSCYLFQCGPPEDFKCKFTHHVNYTSAVLAINRRQPDLENQIKLTKHELELERLRKAELPPQEQQQQVVTTTMTTSTTTKPSIAVKVQNEFANLRAQEQEEKSKQDANLSPAGKKHCKEYQFECRSTGECIAIYNACDGIPQCVDGSDEGPELKCPDASTLGPPLMPHQSQRSNQLNTPGRQPLNVPPIPDASRITGGRPGMPQVPPQLQDSVAGKSVESVARQAFQQSSDFLRPIVDPLNSLRIQQYDPQQLSQYAYLAPGQNSWGHQVPPQMGPHYPQQFASINKNGHIFNHKEAGLQVADMNDQSPNAYTADGRDFQKFPNYYNNDVYSQQMPQLQQMPENNWPTNNNHPQEFRSNGIYTANQDLNSGVPGGRETWSQNAQAAKNEATKIIYQKPATKELFPSNQKDLLNHEQEIVADELKNTKHFATQAEDASMEIGAHGANDGHDHSHSKYMVAKYKLADTDSFQDGIAETPGGAVLSLTLGLILTALMGVLIGCRLRVVRRRLRRGAKSYAHDADYLVNGMYL